MKEGISGITQITKKCFFHDFRKECDDVNTINIPVTGIWNLCVLYLERGN